MDSRQRFHVQPEKPPVDWLTWIIAGAALAFAVYCVFR
jgi:hypothetical protein